jgi:uncharacterized lipoprotein YajG
MVCAILAVLALCSCATEQIAVGISPDEATALLSAGDEISVVGKDRRYAVMKVQEIDEQTITGETNQILLADVESITLMETKRTAAPLWETLEAASYLLILWPFFVF